MNYFLCGVFFCGNVSYIFWCDIHPSILLCIYLSIRAPHLRYTINVNIYIFIYICRCIYIHIHAHVSRSINLPWVLGVEPLRPAPRILVKVSMAPKACSVSGRNPRLGKEMWDLTKFGWHFFLKHPHVVRDVNGESKNMGTVSNCISRQWSFLNF